MVAREKLLDRMRRSPKSDWKIDDLKPIAEYHGIPWRAFGGSHVTFYPPGGHLTVPARRPIKPVYVQQFVRMIDSVRSQRQ